MCTIITVNLPCYMEYEADIIAIIKSDNVRNSDGISLVCIDPDDEMNDVVLKTFSLDKALSAINEFFSSTNSLEARMFLHQRAATGHDVHVGTAHAFNDLDGNYIMHNGILSTARKYYAVDSYLLSDKTDTSDARNMLADLRHYGETFANVFIIRPGDYTYGVVRCITGTLFTDGNGNYSTHQVGKLNIPVPQYYAEEYKIGERRLATSYWNEHFYSKAYVGSSISSAESVFGLAESIFEIGDRVRTVAYGPDTEISEGIVVDILDTTTVIVQWDSPQKTVTGNFITECRADVMDLEYVS